MQRRDTAKKQYRIDDLVGRSPASKPAQLQAQLAATTQVPLTIWGPRRMTSERSRGRFTMQPPRIKMGVVIWNADYSIRSNSPTVCRQRLTLHQAD